MGLVIVDIRMKTIVKEKSEENFQMKIVRASVLVYEESLWSSAAVIEKRQVRGRKLKWRGLKFISLKAYTNRY